jgi:hypothetical protein
MGHFVMGRFVMGRFVCESKNLHAFANNSRTDRDFPKILKDSDSTGHGLYLKVLDDK